MNYPTHPFTSHRINRRTLLLGSSLAAIAAQPISRAFAAQSHDHATPEVATEADVVWTWTDDGMEINGEISAGWNRVTVVNNRSAGMPHIHVLTLRMPDDVTDAQLEELTTEGAEYPDWARACYYPGIPDGVSPGESLTGYTWYAEGMYLWGDVMTDLNGQFTVGPANWNRHLPMSDVRVEMVDMEFLGLDQLLPAGPQRWEVANRGATWHEIVILKTPGPKTVEEILDAMMSDEQWPMEGYSIVGGYGITSPGMSGVIELDLEAGDYIAACMAPDNFAGPPHAFMGMLSPFVVE